MRDDPYSLLNDYITVSHETTERLTLYHNLLLKWQPNINLVSNDSLSDAWQRHFLDSLQLLNHLPSNDASIIDMGSGAGFPGMVLAIAGANNVHLIESDSRKIAFLREVARATKTAVSLHHSRIEEVRLAGDVIISRACANLDLLLSYAFRFVSHGTICLFPKGKNYFKEIEDAKKNWEFDYAVFPSVANKEGIILRLCNLKKRGP